MARYGGTVSAPSALGLAVLLGVSDQTDSSGRLLLEDAAPKRARRKAFKAGISMKAVACNYRETPSRLAGTMNLAAFDALRHDTAEVLNGFAWLAEKHELATGTPPATVRSLFDTSYLGLTIPLVMFFRAENPVRPYGHLPTYVASLFKASRGVFSAAVDLLNRFGPATVLAPEDVVAFADEEGHLMRPETGRACAAPTRLIHRALAAALTGEGAQTTASSLTTDIDIKMLFAFYRVQDGFNEELSAYRHRFAQPLALGFDPTTGVFGHETGAMVVRANAAQANLNQILGRSGAGPLIDLDVLKALL